MAERFNRRNLLITWAVRVRWLRTKYDRYSNSEDSHLSKYTQTMIDMVNFWRTEALISMGIL